MLSFSFALALLFVTLFFRWVWHRVSFARKYRLPNVVPGWPLIGNVLDMPFPAGMWATKLARQYGEMFTLHLGPKTLVFLNSSRVITDLLEKRASIYSSRSHRPMLSGIMSGGARMIFMEYNDRWRSQRKIMHSILNGRQAESKFVPFQDLEAKQMMLETLRDPVNYHKAGQRYANSVILSVIFGRRARDDDDLLAFIMNYTGVLAKLQFKPMMAPPDTFPLLDKIPEALQWWRPFGKRFFQEHVKNFQKEYDLLLKKIEDGTARPCFAMDVIQGAANKEFEISDVEKIYTWSTLIEAGSDTTRVSILQILAGAACYPGWVKKAQALLDEVCGHNAERLPTLSDRARLPYITAVVKEALRWRPFLQIGVPHVLTQDDEYEGYKFPAGTEFTWNAYALSMDEKEHSNPLVYDPDRFMDDDLGKVAKGHWSFGAGRRICVGLNVAANSLWIGAACYLYCFNIEEDPAHPIDQFNTAWEDPSAPPFKVKLTPRSKAHVELMEREGTMAMATEY